MASMFRSVEILGFGSGVIDVNSRFIVFVVDVGVFGFLSVRIHVGIHIYIYIYIYI